MGVMRESRTPVVVAGVLTTIFGVLVVANWRGAADALGAPFGFGRFRTPKRARWQMVIFGLAVVVMGLAFAVLGAVGSR